VLAVGVVDKCDHVPPSVVSLNPTPAEPPTEAELAGKSAITASCQRKLDYERSVRCRLYLPLAATGQHQHYRRAVSEREPSSTAPSLGSLGTARIVSTALSYSMAVLDSDPRGSAIFLFESQCLANITESREAFAELCPDRPRDRHDCEVLTQASHCRSFVLFATSLFLSRRRLMGRSSIRMAAKAQSRRTSRDRRRAHTTGASSRASESLKKTEDELVTRKTLSAASTASPVAESLAVHSSPLLALMPLESAFRLVLKEMPSNRRRGYYPSSFYRNPLLLVSMEMKADGERYMTAVPEEVITKADTERRRANTRFFMPSFGLAWWVCGSPRDVVTERKTMVHGPAGVRKAAGSVRMPPNRRGSDLETFHAAAAPAL